MPRTPSKLRCTSTRARRSPECSWMRSEAKRIACWKGPWQACAIGTRDRWAQRRSINKPFAEVAEKDQRLGRRIGTSQHLLDLSASFDRCQPRCVATTRHDSSSRSMSASDARLPRSSSGSTGFSGSIKASSGALRQYSDGFVHAVIFTDFPRGASGVHPRYSASSVSSIDASAP